MIVFTQSGSTYHIDLRKGLWNKNNGAYHTIREMKTLPVEPWVNTWSEVWPLLAERPSVDRPVVGERLFISGRDDWWLSTEVVDISEDTTVD